MAKTNSERFAEIRRKREAGTSSSLDTSGKMTNSQKFEKLKLERGIGFDTLEKDLTEAGENIAKIYSGWQTPETMAATKSSIESMSNRLKDYQTYMRNYGGGSTTELDDLVGTYQSILDGWGSQTELYGNYQNGDAYNKAMQRLSFDNAYAGKTYEEIQEALNNTEAGTPEYDYLSTFTGYTNLKDFYKALNGESVKASGANDEYLATLEKLKNQYELDHKFDLYADIMDNEDFEENSAYRESEEKGVLNWMADTSHEYIGENMDNETSWAKQRISEKWDSLRKNLFGAENIEYLTDDEVKVYNYIYNTQGKKAASEFLQDMQVTLGRRKEAENQAKTEDVLDKTGPVGQTVGSVLSVPWGVVGDATAAIDDTFRTLAGLEVNPYNSGHALSNLSDNIRDYTREEIENKAEGAEVAGVNVPTFLYDSLLSIGESATRLVATGGLGKAAGTVSGLWAGAGAASDRVKALKEAGATEEQILKGSMAAGAMELIGEKLSIENLLKVKNADGILSVVKEVAKQMGIEASEETVTEVGNMIFDGLIRGGSSDLAKSHAEYLERGYTKEEADRLVWNDIKKDIAVAALGGALSGGILGTGAKISQISDYKAEGATIREGSGASDVMNAEKLTEEGAKVLEEYEKKGITAENITDAQLGNLSSMLTEDARRELVGQRANKEKITTYAELMKDKDAAELFVSQYDGKTDPDYYIDSFELAYGYGKNLIGSDSVIKNKGALTESQLLETYRAGVKSRGTEKIQEQLTEVTKKHFAENPVIQSGKFDISGVSMKNLTNRQKSAVEFARKLSEYAGVNITFFESKADENGVRTDANGWYDHETNTIHVDVYAGLTETVVEESIIPTLSHEMTHWMQDKAPQLYEQLTEQVMNTLAAEQSVEELIAAEMGKKGLSYEVARDELVARACEDMLTNSKVLSSYLAGMDAKSATTLKEKIHEIAEKIKAWIQDLLKMYESSSKEAKVLRKYEKKLNEVSATWDKAMMQAIRTNQATKAEVAPVQQNAESARESSWTLKGYDERQLTNWKNSKRIVVYGNKVQFMEFVDKALSDKTYSKKMYFGMVSDTVADEVESCFGIDIRNFNLSLGGNEIRKTIKSHGNDERESLRGQKAVIKEDFYQIPYVMSKPSDIEKSGEYEGKPCLIFKRDGYNVVGVVSDKHIDLFVQTMYIQKNKSLATPPSDVNIFSQTSETSSGTASTDSISQSEENATENIRFSSRETESVYDTVGEGERLKEENAKLREDVENLKKKIAMEAEFGSEISSTYLKKVAEQLLLKNKSDYDADTLAEQLKDVYEYVKENRDVKWGTLMSKTYEIASGILHEADSDTRVAEYGKKILDAMKQPVSLSPAQVEAAEGMYGEQYRKSLFGKLNISRNGVPLSEMWKEWSALYPDIFDAGVSEADQVAAVLEARQELTDATDALEEYGQKEMARKLAVEIYHQLWNMEPVKGLSEKYESEIRGLRKDHRRMMTEMRKDTVTHYETLLRNARLNRETEVRRVKQEARQKMNQHRENEQKQIKIRKITSNAMRMSRWLTENSAKNHIPEGLKEPVTLLLDSIDFSSKQLLGLNKSKQGEMTKQDISFSEALEKVHTMAAGIRKAQDSGDGEVIGFDGMYVDLPMGYEEQLQEFSKRVNELMRRNGDNHHVLQKMTLEELETLDDIVQTLKTTVTQMNEFLSESRLGAISTAAQSTIRELKEMGKNGEVGESTKKFLYWHNALPIYAFKRFSSAGEALFRSFQRAQSTLAFNVRTIMDYSEDTYTDKEVNEWEKEIHEFEFSDGPGADGKDRKVKVRITTSQLMSLYCLSKREQAQEHLKGGGFKVEDFEDGARKVSQPEGLTMNKGRLYEMLSVLTDRQKEVATRLQAFMNIQCSSWGNEISMRRFGYRAFTEENYFPIQSDENTLNSEAGVKNNELTRLLNMSFTKKLTPHANNRVVIRSIFDVFAEHSSDMAKYNAFALPVLDAYKWYNYQEKIKVKDENEAGSEDVIPFETETVKGAMETAYGKEAKKYFFQFMKDINGSYSAGIGEELAKSFMSKYKVAAVAGNLRVVMLQPLSYVRALEVMDAKYLFSSNVFRKSKADKVMEYSGIAQWKDMGFYDTNITRNVQSLIKHDETWKDKLVEATLRPAACADRFTWSKLWQACEAETRDKRPELKANSEAFNQIVAERFEEVVFKTQVVDSVLTRSQLMRSKSVWAQSFTSFMSEPTVSYNILLEKHMDWNRSFRVAKESGKSNKAAVSQAFHENGKTIARTVYVYCLCAVSQSFVEGLADALRDNDEEDEEFGTLLLENMKDNFFKNINPLALIPGVRDVFSVIEGYSLNRMDEEFISSLVTAARKVQKDFSDEDGTIGYKTVYSTLKAVSQMSGIPGSNLIREVVTIWNNTIGEVYPGMKIK